MYLFDLRAEQVDVPSGPQGWCKVRVTWVHGDQLADVLQLYYQPGGGSNWVPWDELDVQDESDPTDYEGHLLGPDVVQIIAAPRMRADDGSLANTQPRMTANSTAGTAFTGRCSCRCAWRTRQP